MRLEKISEENEALKTEINKLKEENKPELYMSALEIVDEECGCSHSCGNCKNCSCHDELTITQEGEVNE